MNDSQAALSYGLALRLMLLRMEWCTRPGSGCRSANGCTKNSPGCKHCYAERFAERFRGVTGHPFERSAVGEESGPGARSMEASWVRNIKDQCQRADVAFFFKQWGGVQKKRYGRELDERTWTRCAD